MTTDNATLTVDASTTITLNKLRVENDGISMRKIAWEEFRKVDFYRNPNGATYNFNLLALTTDNWLFNRTTSGITDARADLFSTRPAQITIDGSDVAINYTAFLTVIDIDSGELVDIIYTPPPFVPGNFTPPELTFDDTNLEFVDFYFERENINSTYSYLNVTFPQTYDTECTFYYTLAQTGVTYGPPVISNDIEDGLTEASFGFNNVGNDIIDVTCVDTNTNNTGRYILTQTTFELLNALAGIRGGEFGTSGMFGALDMITLVTIIVAMVGFNRVNESVGIIIAIMITGGAAFFGIIAFPTIIFAAIAVIVMLAVATTRRTRGI